MKIPSFPAIVTAALFALTPAVLRAQDTPPPPLPEASSPGAPANSSPAGRLNLGPEQTANILASKLSLTDDQKAQITPILVDRQQRMKALQADTSSRPMQKGKKMKEIMETSDKKINAILTPDQRKQYAEIEEQRRQQMQQRKATGSN